MQLEPARFGGMNTVEAAAAVVADEGPLALTAGGVPTLVGYAVQGCFKYGGFEALKPALYASPLVYGTGGKLAVLLLAGVAAELVASTALCPLEAARIANVRDSSSSPGGSGGSLLATLGAMDRAQAFGGLDAILLKMVPYTAAQLTTYELATSALYATYPNIAAEQPLLVFPATVTCAACAAVVSSLLSQPGDALLSERNRASPEMASDAPPPSLLALATLLGPAGLVRGTQARLVQMLAIVVVQLLVYDSVKQAVGLPLTGTLH